MSFNVQRLDDGIYQLSMHSNFEGSIMLPSREGRKICDV